MERALANRVTKKPREGGRDHGPKGLLETPIMIKHTGQASYVLSRSRQVTTALDSKTESLHSHVSSPYNISL
jgi:hypothetical protein